MLKAISTVLGEAATPEIIDAWGKAYGVLADVFIGAENALRAENEAKPHGWSGFKPFVVDEKVRKYPCHGSRMNLLTLVHKIWSQIYK